MLHIVKSQLLKIINDIDCGNSNSTEEELLQLIDVLKHFTDKTERLSKYQACKYIGKSRAQFDIYVKEGKIPKGSKQQGFNELSWTKKDLDKFLQNK